ncbi:MAG: hypothetical protein R3F60_15070 [bacterium]
MLAAIVGFTVVALAEFGIVASSAAVFDAGAGPGLTVLAHMIGLVGVAGLGVGVLFAVIIPPLVASVSPGRWARAHLWPARDTAADALHGAAAGIVATLAAVGLLAITAGVTGRIAHGFMNPNLALPFVALGGLAGAVVGVLAWFPARQASRAILRKIAPSGRLAGLPAPLLPALLMVLAGSRWPGASAASIWAPTSWAASRRSAWGSCSRSSSWPPGASGSPSAPARPPSASCWWWRRAVAGPSSAWATPRSPAGSSPGRAT